MNHIFSNNLDNYRKRMSESTSESTVKDIVDGICDGYYVGKRGKDRETSHVVTGKFYQCEECGRFFCYNHILDDGWEERLKDGIFMCLNCRALDHIRADIG